MNVRAMDADWTTDADGNWVASPRDRRRVAVEKMRAVEKAEGGLTIGQVDQLLREQAVDDDDHKVLRLAFKNWLKHNGWK